MLCALAAPTRLARPKALSRYRRRGAIAVFAAIMLVAIFAMLAFSVDVGVMLNTHSELKRTVDAAALAGAGALVQGETEAESEVYEFIALNPVAGRTLELSEVLIQLGDWEPDTNTFVEGGPLPSAVRIEGTRRDAPLYFAKVLGFDDYEVTEEAIATYQPRDIVIVLDYSASMNDDSEFRHISRLGQQAIEDNLQQIYEELGSPTYGNMQWEPQYIYSTNYYTILNTLGLSGVPYPYPSGSWYDYFQYVRYDYDVYRAGYYKRYGYLTLVNYWLEKKPKHSQTPDLWMTSEQPITALKNAVTLFLDYVELGDMDDRVGLCVYTSNNGTAVLEHELTYDYDDIDTISRQRQAGHYDYYTNIGDGIRVAREHLVEFGRNGAFKMLVVITDGKANRPNGTDPDQYALNHAQLAANANIPILTISLGADADSDLMEDIADMTTAGVHFNIPGGQTVAEYQEDLLLCGTPHNTNYVKLRIM